MRQVGFVTAVNTLGWFSSRRRENKSWTVVCWTLTLYEWFQRRWCWDESSEEIWGKFICHVHWNCWQSTSFWLKSSFLVLLFSAKFGIFIVSNLFLTHFYFLIQWIYLTCKNHNDDTEIMHISCSPISSRIPLNRLYSHK